MAPCLGFLPLCSLSQSWTLTVLGKDEFLEANRVWLHCFVQCNKAMEVSKCPAEDEVILVRKMSHLELIQDNTETNMKYYRRQSPKWDHQYIWRWHLEIFALTRLFSGYRNSHISQKWTAKLMQFLFFLILTTTDQTLSYKIHNLSGTFTATPVFQITLKL